MNRALLSQRLSPARQRDRDLEAVRELRREYEEAADQGQRTMTVERSQVLAKQYADDPEFQSVFRDFDTFLKTHAREPEKPAPQPPAPEPPAPPPQAVRRSNAGDSIRAVVGQGGAMLAGLRRVRIPRPGVPVPIRGAAKQVAASVRAKPLHWAAGGVVALAIGVGIVFVVFPPKPPLPPPPPRYAVRIETRPAGAAVLLDGQPYDIAKPPALLAGTHRLEAFLDGYERNVQDIRVAPGSQGPYVIQLQPLPTALRISSDLGDDAIAIDGEKVKLEGGEFSADQLAPGPHTLAVSAARYGSLTMTTEVRTGEAPVAAEAPPARELRVLLVSSFRGSARVVANFAPVQLAVDSRPPEELPAAGLTVDNLSPGSHDFSFGEGAEQFKISIDIGAAPSLFASVRTYRTTGDLRIVLAGNGVRIFLDNGERKLKGQRLNDGRFVYAIPSLPPKSYQVRVEKDGFQTQSQSIEVTKGGVAKLDFNLVAIPKPRLEIVGTPRTKVVVAGTSHQTDAAGNLSIEVEPGEHSIELSREGHRPKTLTRNFEAGKRVQLSSGDVVLEKIEVLGKLVVTVSPGGARVTLLQGDREVILTPGSELALQPGSYTVRASAQGHIAQTRTVEVAANKTFPLEIKLAPEPPKPPLVLGMDGFVDAAGWRLEDKWYVRRGGGRVAFRPSLTLGSFRFSLLRKTGLLGRWSGVRWFFRYGARGEYVQFRIDKGTFYCRINSGDEKKLASYRTDQDVLPIDIRVYGDRIEHQVFDGKTWEVIGVWKIPGGDIARGQFGFLIGNDEEVWLTSFKFQAAR